MKTIFVFFALLLLSSSTVFAAPPRIAQDEIEGAASLAVNAYKAGGMSGIANQSNDCWKKVGLKSYLCLYLDLAGRYIDQSIAKNANFPLTPYFADEEFGRRAAEVYRFNNVDMQVANRHLATAQQKINSAVKINGNIVLSSDTVSAKEITTRGEVVVGTLDSSIGDGAGFLTESEVAKKIFSVCKSGDVCEVTGKADESSGMLISVSRVRKLSNDVLSPETSRICSDSRTQRGARLAIENGYVSVGAPVGMASPFIKMLPKLSEYTGHEADAIRRNVSRSLNIRQDDLHICRIELSPNAFLVIMVARNSHNEIGYLATNIGIPGATGVEGWLINVKL